MIPLSKMPLILILAGLIPAFTMPALARWKRELCAPYAIAVCGLVFSVALYLFSFVVRGEVLPLYVGGWEPPWGIEIAIDPLSGMMAILITGLALLIAIYSYHALRKEMKAEARGWYYVEFLLCMVAMLGLVITKDLFNMYVFIEVVGLSACALVVSKGERIAVEASLKYLILATIGSGFVVFGIGFIYMVTGHLNMAMAGQVLVENASRYPYLLWAAMSFFVVGFGVKSALFPLHLWLPDAHSSAPSPSSAVLSSLVVKVYIVALFKIFFVVFGTVLYQESYIRYLILILASAAMVGGSLFAFVQLELKRRLAYSTVAQIGYIYLGIGLGTPWAIVAAFMHLIVHALMKTCLFLCAGAIYYQTGRKKVTQLAGLGAKMPLTAAAMTVASFSMVGIPLTGGFISKFMLARGSIEAGYPYFIILIVVSGLLNAMYYFPILWQIYFVSPGEHDEHGEDQENGTHGNQGDHGSHDSGGSFKWDQIPLTMKIPIAATAAGVVVLGIVGIFMFDYLQKIVSLYLG
ncbi:MAG: monovalent cation/H+ antiporter subunit D family protein [Bacillota bacterium]